MTRLMAFAKALPTMQQGVKLDDHEDAEMHSRLATCHEEPFQRLVSARLEGGVIH